MTYDDTYFDPEDIADIRGRWDIGTLRQILATAESLHAAVSSGKPHPYETYGLCHALRPIGDDGEIYMTRCEAADLFALLYKGWPEHSGWDEYPVPAPAGYAWSDEDYHSAEHACFCETAYMYKGEYGAARIRLLEFVIRKLQLCVARHE